MEIQRRITVTLVGLVGLVGLVFGCSSSTTIALQPDGGGGDGFGSGPPIPASQVGGTCTGVGTSPGETATFAMADCPAGICVADARTGLDAYCTADCAAHSCPSGFVCQATSVGATKYACLKDQSGGGDDSGSGPGDPDAGSQACALAMAQGPYTESYRTTDANCPPLSSKSVTLRPGVGVVESGTECTSSEDLSACTLTEDCTANTDGGTITEKMVASAQGGAIRGTMTLQFNGSLGSLHCTYSVIFTP
jgi:hypothetical protein